MNLHETDKDDSETNSCTDKETTSEPEPKKKSISLSPELVLLKDVIRSEIKSELDKSIDNKLEPLQTSLNSLVANSSLGIPHTDIRQINQDNLLLKIQCMKVERENSELRSRVKVSGENPKGK